MAGKQIYFDRFEIPRMRGLRYLMDENKAVTDYLFIGDRRGGFSMYFESNFPIFTVPKSSERPYCLFEIKNLDRSIRFFCPERLKNLDSVIWYFYLEIYDENGVAYGLPGQVRIGANEPCIRMTKGKPKFVEVLEQVKLHEESYA